MGGGYFDYETGSTPNHWYSAIQFWNADARPIPGHPITRGVRPWTAQEEFYYRVKFRGPDPLIAGGGDPRLRPILGAKPPGETNEFTVAWAVERADGGRGFATTGGHFFANYWLPDWRRMILNAIAWTAHIDPPEGGIRSEPMERFDLLVVTGANHPSHDWPATTAALVSAIEQDPRVRVRVTEDPEDLAKPETLASAKAVIWNYVNWERPGLSAEARAAFLGYLERGGGLELIHFGASAFHPSLPNAKPQDVWAEFSQRIARRVWEHRPPSPSAHDAYGLFRVTPVSAAEPPILQGLPPFETEDELYYNQAGEAPVTALAEALCKGSGKVEPLAWAYPVGDGRVFQTTLGHSAVSVRRAAALIRRGAVWAAGRPPLAYDPPLELLDHVLWREGSQWKPHAAPTTAAAAKAAAPLAGSPTISGRAPEAQKEADWSDNRWQLTDLGPFLATYVSLADGPLARGLAIKAGGAGAATLLYDTATGMLVAGWRGGFLTYNSSRFGLLNPPAPASTPEFLSRDPAPWGARRSRFLGQYVQGERVALSWSVGGVPVLESPSAEAVAGGWAWVRDLEIGPDVRGGACSAGTAPGLTPVPNLPPGIWAAVSGSRGEVTVLAITGQAGVSARVDKSRVEALWRPSDQASALSIVRWRGPAAGVPAFCLWAAARTRADVSSLTRPGPLRWGPGLETVGELGRESGALAVDTLTLPYDNPWKALLFGAGVDFDSSGAGYFCTIHGDVWRVTGVDEGLRKLHWQRFATGLFQPLGLRVRDDEVFVLGRDRITRLHDYNQDGEADFYETFCDQIQTSPNGHQYVTSLELDDSGNFYYADPEGVHRVGPDGQSVETLATGLRNPNGMGVKPDGSIITVAPQQGNWTPSSVVFEVHPGEYYGFGGPKVLPGRPLGYDTPLLWIPHAVDNSSGGQAWLPDGVWGPLGGHCLHLLWGRCGLMMLLRDAAGSRAQGAVVSLPAKFISGPDRAVFRAKDGCLYVAGSTGWQTSALRDGCLQRVRWTGKGWRGPVGWRARSDGLEFTFSEPLSRAAAEDAGSFGLKRWNYRYAEEYGSKDWSVSQPQSEGREVVEIRASKLSADGRTVILETPGLGPAMQMELKYHLETPDQTPMSGEIWMTVHAAGTPAGR